ncbi:FecCD family ABC transporter permease [Brevibacterium litoralis]|uniref:FecCD family ABC transporter permease n=1 Tax=Brevibacterium litoralis TaxID=3138935 RepID=UPI0032ED8219
MTTPSVTLRPPADRRRRGTLVRTPTQPGRPCPDRGRVTLALPSLLPTRTRPWVVWGVLVVLAGVLVALTLTLGELGLGMSDLVATLGGDPPRKVVYVFEVLRGPRVLVALGAGAAFGLAGALFQAVTRNPLGSPDVIGLSSGAGAGVAVATLLFPVSASGPVGALAGAALAIGLVWVSTGRGFDSTARLIIAGIAVAAMAHGVTQFVVTATLRDQAAQLAAYLVGSLNARNWEHVLIIGTVVLVALPVVVRLAHRFRAMELGDEVSTVLGEPAGRVRTEAVVVSVLLGAGAVSVAGPVLFISLMSPHLARMLTRESGANVCGAALVGAVLLTGADLVVQQVPWVEGLPVGVVTAGIGGVYLGHLLLAQWKKQG